MPGKIWRLMDSEDFEGSGSDTPVVPYGVGGWFGASEGLLGSGTTRWSFRTRVRGVWLLRIRKKEKHIL